MLKLFLIAHLTHARVIYTNIKHACDYEKMIVLAFNDCCRNNAIATFKLFFSIMLKRGLSIGKSSNDGDNIYNHKTT